MHHMNPETYHLILRALIVLVAPLTAYGMGLVVRTAFAQHKEIKEGERMRAALKTTEHIRRRKFRAVYMKG